MNIEELRDYCLHLKGAVEDFPFDEVTIVMKVQGKMFALIPLDADELSIALKCDPAKAVSLREQYESVKPGYHLNKKHWNTVYLGNDLPRSVLFEMIDESYSLVVSGLPRKSRTQLENS